MLKPCGCIEDGRPCAKACGLDMTGWICEAERTSPAESGHLEHVGCGGPVVCDDSNGWASYSCSKCKAHNLHDGQFETVIEVSQPSEPAGLPVNKYVLNKAKAAARVELGHASGLIDDIQMHIIVTAALAVARAEIEKEMAERLIRFIMKGSGVCAPDKPNHC